MYKVLLHKQAVKDLERLQRSGLGSHALKLRRILEQDPFQPLYEKLKGVLEGAYSCRINIQHRLVYQVMEDQKVVRILRMWTHYE